MIDSISNTNGAGAASRAQSAAASSSLRASSTTLNTIVQTQQRSSGATAPVTTALAVPQSAKSGSQGNVKLPRGSLVDVLA